MGRGLTVPVEREYYDLLGVAPDASEEQIKRAYRRLARELHPDSTGGDPAAEARFKQVAQAYEVLRDPERRARYDRYGASGVDGAAPDPFGGGLGDLFDAFFGMAGGGRGRGRSGPARGVDAELVVTLAFREAVFGARKEIAVDVAVACPACDATGARRGTSAIRCPDCGGTGELRRVRQSILGQVVTAVTCPRCQGLGESIPTPCPECGGEGRRSEHRVITIDVPAGVDDGATLRLAGQGPAGPRGGPAGDLYVHLRVEADERFARRNDDLHAELHVAMTQAALGAVVAVETLDGPEQLTLAPGTQSGTVLRLRGRGVPHVRGRGRGDLLVHVVVDTPTDLDGRQRELLRQLAAARGEAVGAGSDGLVARLRSAFG